jgi:uncharacterized protein (TIGR03086 family)
MAGLTGLLERAIRYALENVEAVAPGHLSRRTPCADWDLRTLLLHVNDSVGALQQGFEAGCVDLVAAEEDYGDGDPAIFRARTRRLLRAWAAAERRIFVGGRPMAAELMAITGAIEIAVHGWDVSVACGRHRPIPALLAVDMLRLSPLVIDDVMRDSLFAAPVAMSPLAGPSDRLVAFFGRCPR